MGRKSVSFKLRGKLPQLAGVPKEVIAAAMPRIVKRVEEQAREEAPKRRGYGSGKSIVSRIKGKVEAGGQRGIIRSGAPHSHLIHMGVKSHSLVPGSGKRRWKKKMNPRGILNLGGKGNKEGPFRMSATHPGHGKNEYMYRAIPGAERDIDKVLEHEGNQALLRAVAKGIDLVGDVLP